MEPAGDREVSVCAAYTAQQLLCAGLLDEIDLSVVPYLLGSGVRLFDYLGPEPIELEQYAQSARPGQILSSCRA